MDERTQAVLGPSWRTEQGRGAAGGVAAAGSLRCPHEGEGPPAVLRRQLHCHRREGTEMHCQPEGGGCPRPPAMASCAANWGWGVLPGEGGSWSYTPLERLLPAASQQPPPPPLLVYKLHWRSSLSPPHAMHPSFSVLGFSPQYEDKDGAVLQSLRTREWTNPLRCHQINTHLVLHVCGLSHQVCP